MAGATTHRRVRPAILYAASVRPGNHPTQQALVEATVAMLDEMPAEDITAVLVLERTGISSGSMYHFFDGFSDLLEAAYLRRFSDGVVASTTAIRSIVDESADAEDFLTRLEQITRATQDRVRLAGSRFERARILAMTVNNPRFRATLGELQQQLTDGLTACFADAQAKGWLNTTFKPRTGAVFIQAYTLGRIVDDITGEPMDDEDWVGLITRISRTALA